MNAPKLSSVFRIQRPLREASGMSLEDAMDATVTKAQAQAEIKKHDQDWNEFVRDVGDKPSYKGSEVLEWLGY